jgi:ABC-type uncharacterized transport system permease subunit
MMSEIFSVTVLVGILASGIRLATPYLYASIGETFGQRSGVLNLGVEGQQGISGIGFYLFGLGMSTLLFQMLVGEVETVSGFPPLEIPILSNIPILGQIFFSQSLLVYAAYLLVPAAWFVLNKTNIGMKVRAVGENPEAADSLGVSVGGVRYITVTMGGVMSAVAGASLSIALLNVFQQNMTSGLGFIAVALVYFGGWRPFGVLLGALLFSMVISMQLWFQVLGIGIPSDLAVMLPYILTIVALVLTVQRVRAPSALTKPFEREG